MTPADEPDAVLSHFRHDLRTPVNAILGYAELVLEDDEGTLPADLGAGVADLRELGHQLLAAIGGFQPPADPTAADVRGVFAVARTALSPTAEQVVARAARLAARADAAGLADVAQDVGRIWAAGQALQQVLASGGDVGIRNAEFGMRNEDRPSSIPHSEFRIPNSEDAPRPPAITGHVLIVDDDPANRHLFARNLQRQGHTFALAADGVAALDLVAAHPFDLVLLDMIMPGLSGLEVLTRLKRDPARAHIPVVVVSALDQLDGVVQCLEAGAEDYLPKPCNPVLLRARLGACLEKKRLRDRELEYLRQAEAVAAAAAAVEAGTYDLDPLTAVADRPDALGTLARVFGRMAREVKAREARLRQEVLQLRVEIDESRKAKQVAEITGSDFFEDLVRKAATLRAERE